jgi:hypothetical protein
LLRNNQRIVLVTDSKSALQSLKTTWLRRINFMEQSVTRLLHGIASEGAIITLAFVFSHVGGAPGNEFIDNAAERAVFTVGRRWTSDIWNIDSTRRILHNRHDIADANAGWLDSRGHRRDAEAFRFRHLPASLVRQPSTKLPREMPRAQERLLYQARVGLFTAAGGVHHNGEEACPLCGEEDAMSRNGGTMEHLVECVKNFTSPPMKLEIADLWTNTEQAAAYLQSLAQIVRSTAAYHERCAR